MEQADVFAFAVEVLERLKIPYMVVGSAASSIYGEPRMTQDIDLVIDPTPRHLDEFCAAFDPREFYLSRDAAHDALRTRTQFNIIHPASGNKIDVMISGNDAWGRSQLARRRRVALLPAVEAVAAAPDDVIIAKMLYYHEGGSEKHLRDIAGILKVSGSDVDRQYVQRWADELGLSAIWDAILRRIS